MKSKYGQKRQEGKNQFQVSWLETFKDWTKAKSNTHVTCTICNKDVAFDNMGESALTCHMKPNPPGQKPTKHQQRIEDKAKAKWSLSVLHSVDPSQLTDLSTTVQSGTSSQPTITQYVQPMCIVMAEIRWTMKVVLSHHSFRSCLDINDLFSAMFPDSCIAKKFAMSKTKCAYCINYGLAPFYKEKLLSEIKKSPYYTIMFDESLNKILQKDQMDVYIRYWCGESNQVKTMYFDTKFFFRPNADNNKKYL